MPSSTSIYSKVQLVLEFAKTAQVESIAALEATIRRGNPLTFHTRHFERSKDSFVTTVSERAIHNAVTFCRELKLLKPDGSLTAEGRQASRRAKFNQIISNQIVSHFEEAHIDITELNKRIVSNLQLIPPRLPTAKEIWEPIAHSMEYPRFARMLNLLGQCGGAESSQKKIYLQINQDTRS